MLKTRIAVLVSGGGTNLQAIIDAQKNGIITDGEVCVVITSNDQAYALERAKNNNIDGVVVAKKGSTQDEFEANIIKVLDDYKIDLIVLAGFMCILSENFTKRYPERIVIIDASLPLEEVAQNTYLAIKERLAK